MTRGLGTAILPEGLHEVYVVRASSGHSSKTHSSKTTQGSFASRSTALATAVAPACHHAPPRPTAHTPRTWLRAALAVVPP